MINIEARKEEAKEDMFIFTMSYFRDNNDEDIPEDVAVIFAGEAIERAGLKVTDESMSMMYEEYTLCLGVRDAGFTLKGHASGSLEGDLFLDELDRCRFNRVKPDFKVCQVIAFIEGIEADEVYAAIAEEARYY